MGTIDTPARCDADQRIVKLYGDVVILGSYIATPKGGRFVCSKECKAAISERDGTFKGDAPW